MGTEKSGLNFIGRSCRDSKSSERSEDWAGGSQVRNGGDRDLGVAFQMHPGRQAFISSRSTETRSALKRDGFLLELTGWTKRIQGS